MAVTLMAAAKPIAPQPGLPAAIFHRLGGTGDGSAASRSASIYQARKRFMNRSRKQRYGRRMNTDSGFGAAARQWLIDRLPTPERLLASRWVRPFAHRLGHPLLWHLNRRSIARGIALGLFAGFLIPLGQTPAAALLAFTARANVLVAAIATLITNPLTVPPIYFAAYTVGRTLVGGDAAAGEHDLWFARALAWLTSLALPTAIGLLLFAVVASTAGYSFVHVAWRWRVWRRWQGRCRRRRID
jgi:uncharacterized protein